MSHCHNFVLAKVAHMFVKWLMEYLQIFRETFAN